MELHGARHISGLEDFRFLLIWKEAVNRAMTQNEKRIEKGKVSIIVPVYNGKQYIESAIHSLLGEDFTNFEIIIVDDGSTDETSNLIKKNFGSSILLVRKTNGGACSAINEGVRHSTGEYIAFCDQDDIWDSTKLKKQVDYLESHPAVGMVYSDAFVIDENGHRLGKTWMESRRVEYVDGGYEECAMRLFERNFICAPLVVMIRKSVIEEIGPFNERFSSAYDYEYWFRVLEGGVSIGFIDEPLASWRTHGGQESGRVRKQKRMMLGIWWEFFKRKPEFPLKHPFLVAKKVVRGWFGILLNRTAKVKY